MRGFISILRYYYNIIDKKQWIREERLWRVSVDLTAFPFVITV